MPIYNYKCFSCDNVVEIWKGINNDNVELCPKCQAKMDRIIAKSSFILKGGGWYSEGYNKKKEKE